MPRRGDGTFAGGSAGGPSSLPPGASGAAEGGERWRCVDVVRESHGRPVYCVAFNCVDPAHLDLFAAVGSNRATVYRCTPEGGTELVQAYVDTSKEDLFCCAWSVDVETGAPLLLVAGDGGVVTVWDTATATCRRRLVGHGGAVNDVRVHPYRPQLVATASKDESVRMWNLTTGACVLMFCGSGGHRNEVLSVDFHLTPGTNLIVSGSMDQMVKVWSYNEVIDTVDASDAWDKRRAFPTRTVQWPVFSTYRVHDNYVDCVRFVGDMVLSKSVRNRLLLWRPEDDPRRKKDAVRVLHEYHIHAADIWFMRASVDLDGRFIACGNRLGNVFVWDNHHEPFPSVTKLVEPQCTRAVRQTAISADGRRIVACCDDASVWRW